MGAKGARYASEEDWRRAAKVCREAIALRPNDPRAYSNLGGMLSASGHHMESAKWYLKASELYLVGSEMWAERIASAFNMLYTEQCDERVMPKWWNDEGLKALSARILQAAPNRAWA